MALEGGAGLMEPPRPAHCISPSGPWFALGWVGPEGPRAMAGHGEGRGHRGGARGWSRAGPEQPPPSASCGLPGLSHGLFASCLASGPAASGDATPHPPSSEKHPRMIKTKCLPTVWGGALRPQPKNSGRAGPIRAEPRAVTCGPCAGVGAQMRRPCSQTEESPGNPYSKHGTLGPPGAGQLLQTGRKQACHSTRGPCCDVQTGTAPSSSLP